MKWSDLIKVSVLLSLSGSLFAKNIPDYKDRNKPVEVRVHDLLRRMTLEEKIAELNLVPYYASSDSAVRAQIRQGKIGALLKANGAALNRSLQEEAVGNSRLGIPLIFHEDVIHGYRTLSPIPLAESCSWDTVMVRRSAEAAAREATASGIQLTYAPMVDVSNDPRWGRIMETSGEDAFLGAAMAAARVRGFQGDNLSDGHTLAACVKHFIGYAALLGGRDYQNTDFSYRDLKERYLPPFQAAIDAGVSSVMCSYTSYDGEPVTMNRRINTDLLREEMQFKGLYMSDWTTLGHAVTEGASRDGRESSRRAMESGLDMDMSSGQYARWLRELVLAGEIDSSLIDRAAARALTLKFTTGLFDDPYKYFDVRKEKKITGSREIRQTVLDMALESMVLLKNDSSALPLSGTEKIALAGPFTDMKADLMGSWTMKGQAGEVVSVWEGFCGKMPRGQLIHAGCTWDGVTPEYIAGLKERVREADVVLACIGEYAFHIGEAVTTGRLQIPEEQIQMLRALKATGKPVIAVLFNGRPLVLDQVLASCDALLEAWYPGTLGGTAVASLLLGETSPSGKLTQTFPRHAGQVPVAYNFRRSFARIEHADLEKGPQFPFGFGLSYTTFAYGRPETDRTEYAQGDTVCVKVRVRNTGRMAAREVVQLYVRDEVATVIPREKELKGFASVFLQPGESREVLFRLPWESFRIWNNRMEHVLEPGVFTLQTGGDSEKVQSVQISFR
ncbi:glycoside hydrolase family 3 N-terminal domain-containing protein [Phocaeicola coprophilus]|uniref:glycoside hydrolase family 3 N-terminal domain-containing protein n=1 Tax=Phocaeicola coprophilus TaxID=387090 RepID=UPI003AB8D6DA